MLNEFTKVERYVALGLALFLALAGLILAAVGRDSLVGSQGWIVLLFGLLVSFAIVRALSDRGPEPDDFAARLKEYDDAPTKAGIVLAMVWVVFALFVGDWLAWALAYSDLNFDQPWSNFGRLRPSHTTGVIFGFGGIAARVEACRFALF